MDAMTTHDLAKTCVVLGEVLGVLVAPLLGLMTARYLRG